jgi:phage-related tail fiber protein
VNDQTGVAAYTTQQSDSGSEIVFSDASPIAVTINPAVLQVPWFTTISNQGAGTATITPSSGTINGVAALTLPGGSWVTVFFDGVNFWADSPGSTVGGVTQIVAGAGIALTPSGGTGAVTVTVIGASGSYTSGNNANGYWQKDPAGLIRQWGHVTAGVTGTVVTFPTAFSSATSIEVNTTSLWSSGSIAFVSVESGSITTAQFQVAMGVTATQEFNWFAIGY